MPYNPSTDVYTLPAIYLAIPGTTIIAAQHNDPLVDLQTAQNYQRPVIAGGTGANTPAGARANLGAMGLITSVDNNVPRFDGTGGGLQASALTIADSGAATLVGPTSTIESTDAGATEGPVNDLYRNSSSPLAADIGGVNRYSGEDSAGNKETYAEDRLVILDPTSTSEDGKIVTRTVVAGTLADRVHRAAGMWMEGATGGDPGVGKINAVDVQKNGVSLGLTSGTAQATTSGTSIDFTSIPAGVKRITLSFSGLSTNGNSIPIVQIGDSGGIENTGYLGACASIDGSGTVNASTFTTGFGVMGTMSAAIVTHGSMVLTLIDPASNTWAASTSNGRSNSGTVATGGGSKPLSATLDRVRLTTVNGTDTFDAGLANILYEG